MKKIITYIFLSIIVSCGGGSDNHEIADSPLQYVKSGQLTIVSPGERYFNIEYLDSGLPTDKSLDFLIDQGNIVPAQGGIETIELGSIPETIEFPDISSIENMILNEFGNELKYKTSDLAISASLLQTKKIIIHINENRIVALLKVGDYIGGYDRSYFIWALYE